MGSRDSVQVLVGCTSSVSWYTRWEPLRWPSPVIVLLLSCCPSVRESCTRRCSRCRTYSLPTTTRWTRYNTTASPISPTIYPFRSFSHIVRIAKVRNVTRRITPKINEMQPKNTNDNVTNFYLWKSKIEDTASVLVKTMTNVEKPWRQKLIIRSTGIPKWMGTTQNGCALNTADDLSIHLVNTWWSLVQWLLSFARAFVPDDLYGWLRNAFFV